MGVLVGRSEVEPREWGAWGHYHLCKDSRGLFLDIENLASIFMRRFRKEVTLG